MTIEALCRNYVLISAGSEVSKHCSSQSRMSRTSHRCSIGLLVPYVTRETPLFDRRSPSPDHMLPIIFFQSGTPGTRSRCSSVLPVPYVTRETPLFNLSSSPDHMIPINFPVRYVTYETPLFNRSLSTVCHIRVTIVQALFY